MTFIRFSSLLSLAVSTAIGVTVPLNKRQSTPISSITSEQWSSLNESVGGRLAVGYPIAKPCFDNPLSSECADVQGGYTTDLYIADNFGGYQNANWGFCQKNANDCGLDFTLPSNPLYFTLGQQCHQGSVPSYYIDVEGVSDVQAGLKFAEDTGVPLVIKNSGHDYRGRSSAPDALALWTHNIQPDLTLERDFIPEGCSEPAADGVTYGAGQGFLGLYQFAEDNNITIVGGSSRTVGAGGGWLAAGGHSALSNTLGMGVDNVLQIKAILPNGTCVTANRCQNQDVFYALRGGGGSTFGVNMEITTTAHPRVTLQVAYIRFVSLDPESIEKFVTICVENGDKWATEGWGGYITPGARGKLSSGLVLVTPKLTNEEAKQSMKPLTDYASSLGNLAINNEISTAHSWFEAFNDYILPNDEEVGLGIALGSRLIPKDVFTSDNGRQSLINALTDISDKVTPLSSKSNQLDPRALTYGPPLQILVTAPSSYPDNDTVPASITPAWRQANWHIFGAITFNNSPNQSTINRAFGTAHEVANILAGVAPNSGVYQNEADTFQDNHEQAFWGQENYDRLLELKQEMDPNNILTCWQCIGYDASDPRYGCYPSMATS
ncbi:hypothetical protein KC343_g6969 [Hortaea werneckii]|uniref:FAD-binding PCMH-type domain-containing protein n=1 Tax=Hortaea werneckii TaxID=91943 RepID=A0A3M7FPC2_HORWE|nr:hypothetical protein KC352_g14439 [Hortaea werneckii]KAI7564177.1 hypothetical protein KC317_g7230 [Hortaea werneckii]KAI7614542.1 hypothetical protein KC346_g6885 [Hortaea werneckii]KAI7624459.1 hypothetical protein KC343_g6969 [Hortaea werneckii]KAI7666702.1 hypothetical protein KC319_g6864 [Hortaea werneckii]